MIIYAASDVVTLITLIVGLVGAIAALIPTLIKLFSAIKEITTNKNWSKLKDAAMAAMKEVEEYSRSHKDMSSKEKLDMAIDLIQASAA